MIIDCVKLLCFGLLLSLFCLTILSDQNDGLLSIHGSDELIVPRSFDFDTVSFDTEDDYQFMNEYLDTTGIEHISRAISPKEIMVILNHLGVPTVLEEPLFLHTNILNKRSLLDQPIFEPDRVEFPGSFVIGVAAFAHKTERSNFTRSSDNLNSYIALSEASLILKIENAIEQANIIVSGLMIDVAKIFSLFENMTVQERQVGFMLHSMKRWSYTTLRCMIPIYYLESNFSLTKKEQDAVAKELGAVDPKEEKKFRKDHFISDKIGFGDMRLELDHTLLKRPSFTLRCGGLATIPTAFIWGGGFLGSLFPQPSTLPTFALESLFAVLENPSIDVEEEAKNVATKFFLDALDRVDADLIDVPLGNNGHLGLGVYIRGKTPLSAYMKTSFAQKIRLANRVSLELFFPATEKRFYINKINEAAFSNHNFEDLDFAAENVQFLKEQAISRLFLRAFNTRVIPGVIFRWSSGAYYKGERFGWNLGTDFWLQNKARLSSINASAKTLQEIDIPKAKQPVAQQSKIFGGLVFKHKTYRSNWFFSINADAVLNTKGLGQDFSLSLNFESSF